MNIVLFTSPGTNGSIVFQHLQKNYTVLGVVYDSPVSKKIMIRRRIKKLGYWKVFLQLLFMKGVTPLLQLESKKRQDSILKGYNVSSLENFANIYKPSSINDPKVIDFVNNLNADFVMVCGTRLIKKNIIENINIPLINMHVGITPKYRGVHGGYWALVNKDSENCGVTVHLIDTGIDTGGIISQKIISPSKSDNYSTYPSLQIIKGLDCIDEAVQKLKQGKLTTFENGLPSKLYYHPTIIEYLYHRVFKGVK